MIMSNETGDVSRELGGWCPDPLLDLSISWDTQVSAKYLEGRPFAPGFLGPASHFRGPAPGFLGPRLFSRPCVWFSRPRARFSRHLARVF